MFKYFALFIVAAWFIFNNSFVRKPVASTNFIPITEKHIYNITGQKNPERLFDNDLSTKMDAAGFAGNQFATPMEWFVVLDSTYTNMKLDYFHYTGPSSWTMKVYGEDTVNQRRTFTFGGAFNTWVTVSQLDTVSFPIRFIFFTTLEPSSSVMEMKFYGDAQALGINILPDPAPKTPDPGRYFQGVGTLDDKDVNYMDQMGSMRVSGSMFAYARDNLATFSTQPFSFTHYGDLKTRKWNFTSANNIEAQLYVSGSNILTCPTCLPSNTFTQLANGTNHRKDIPIGSDSTLYSNWALNNGRFWRSVAHIWGNNPASVLPPGYSLSGTTTTVAQNYVRSIEVGNEDDKTWGTPTMAAYHSPKVMLAKLRAANDSAKAADPNIRVMLGALYSMRIDWWKGMWFLNYWNHGSKNFPADGICFNQYITDAYGGQPKGFNTNNGISPERFKLREMLLQLDSFGLVYLPGKYKSYTEFGWTPNSGSNYNVGAIGEYTAEEVKGHWGMRALELASLTYLDRMYWYWQTDDGTTDFGGMRMVVENFNGGGAYIGSTALPVWYFYKTRLGLHANYRSRATLVVNGDSTGTWVTSKKHLNNPEYLLVPVWRGSSNGSSASFEVPINDVVSATLVTLADGQPAGVSTPLTPSGPLSRVTITSKEGMQYIIMRVRLPENRTYLKRTPGGVIVVKPTQ